MTLPLLELNNVSKSYKISNHRVNSIKELLSNYGKSKSSFSPKKVLDDISFKVERGEIVGILGRNGAGKSTLLKLISDIYLPDTGEVQVRGHLLPLLGLGSTFHPDLTGYENVFLTAAILGMQKQEIERTLQDIVAFSELDEKIYQSVKYYSSGMILRLAFSIATFVDAQVLLLDEVLTVGDEGFRQKSLSRIKEIFSSKTILLVTHNIQEVRDFCTRCIVIENSKVIFDGDKEEGIRTYENLFK